MEPISVSTFDTWYVYRESRDSFLTLALLDCMAARTSAKMCAKVSSTLFRLANLRVLSFSIHFL